MSFSAGSSASSVRGRQLICCVRSCQVSPCCLRERRYLLFLVVDHHGRDFGLAVPEGAPLVLPVNRAYLGLHAPLLLSLQGLLVRSC
jgi:hypothetical protein